jgi:4-alpha-glucanotransferase
MTSSEPAWTRPAYAQAIHAALHALDKTHLVLVLHDVSFPAGDDDLGRGSPYSEAARQLYRFARALGFTAVQLGPQGRTTPANPSPYDAMLFSRDPPALAFAPLLPAAELRALVANVPAAAARHGDPVGAHARAAAALDLVAATGSFAAEVTAFARAQSPWLDRDAAYAACAAEFATEDWRAWPAGVAAQAIAARRPDVTYKYRLAQYLLQRQHDELLQELHRLQLKLHGDMQIGISHQDSYWQRALFLPGYKLGAPPSRTNPEGQPWGYPVLDPAQYATGAGALAELRATRLLAAYDGLRVDHPHGLVDPWVYRDGAAADALAAVQAGARLFSSPDLPDHPHLQPFAIARPEQLDRAQPRYHDNWVVDLDGNQVSQYALLLNRLLAEAQRRQRGDGDLMCEVLSTWPYPLRRVMEREGLGRLLVTQKATVTDAHDVYRSDNAQARDWIMVGNHDTPPIWRVLERWQGTGELERRADFLTEILEPVIENRQDFSKQLRQAPGKLATALFAELFASRANHVSIFFADLLGYREIYNAPGTVSDGNWRLRIQPDYQRQYATDILSERALHLPRALALALKADRTRQANHQALITLLESL